MAQRWLDTTFEPHHRSARISISSTGWLTRSPAFIVRLMSPLLRAAQTGFTQNYALVMVLGLVAAVAIDVWR